MYIRKLVIGVVLLLIIVASVVIIIFYASDQFRLGGEPRVIEEDLVLPDTKRVAENEGRITERGRYDTPIIPKNESERVEVVGAIYTLKESFDIAVPEAKKWADDAKLVFVKSKGAVTLEGRSSQWQAIFGSEEKKAGYEVIVQRDAVVLQKEIASDEYGYDLPKVNWYDSSDAIASLNLPQFTDATLSSVSFYYNKDGRKWGYAIATSLGVTAMPVQ